MSESGCLHNNKYESVEVKNHVESNEYTVTEEFSVDKYSHHQSKLSTKIMYSCGTKSGRYNPIGHKNFSSAIDKDGGAEGTNMPSDKTERLKLYNNYFMHLSPLAKTFVGSNDQGKIDFGAQPGGSAQAAITSRFFEAYVVWPANSILYDLTIIPSTDIENNESEGSYGETPTQQTAERNVQELIINLFSVSLDEDNITQIVDNIDTISTEDASVGPLHMGMYPAFDRHSYLIRDFPILAAAEIGKKRRWYKHTPICVVREGGLPIEILSMAGNVYHQHATSSSHSETDYDELQHGSKDQNTSTITSAAVSAGGADTSEINRSNTSPAGEPWVNFSFNNIQRRLNQGSGTFSNKKTHVQNFRSFDSVDKTISGMGQFYNHSENVGLMMTIGTNGTGVLLPLQEFTLESGPSIKYTQYENAGLTRQTISIHQYGPSRDIEAGTPMTPVQFKAIFTFKSL